MSSAPRKPFSWKPRQVSDHRPALRMTASGRRWDVRLVGLISRNRFLVTHPKDDGKLVFIKEGECFDVANFDGLVLSAFESSVLRVVLGEAPGLELSLPPIEQRRRETVRRARRVTLNLPCSVRHGADADALRAGFTGDLSEQGAQVAIEHPLPAGVQRVDLSLRLVVSGTAQTLQLPAQIRSQADDPRPEVSATLLGLQFDEMEPTTRMTLALFVCERLLSEGDDVFGAIR
ncbi:MAG TPA: PilZ domain-containing protein [Burkholderiaceae bacterium]|nr:PilZ domain-containing protein [Burkholderiaceae bacterium]